VFVSTSSDGSQKLTVIHWLILIIASIGFAFDSYELLMLPLIAQPALAELLHVDLATTQGNAQILEWTTIIFWSSAMAGGIFGLIGGYLTDLFGRRRVLVWSILIYAVSALAAGFSTSVWMLLILRCTTLIGVFVEFVAAVAWLAELFPHAKQRETILGITQAFSSVGGIMATAAFYLISRNIELFPAIASGDNVWRYTLISGVIPALPLILIRPFLPESPAWKAKKAEGTLKRPSIGELFQPAYLRTCIVTTVLMACCYGAAYGAIQLTPQIVPGLKPELTKEIAGLRRAIDKAGSGTPEGIKLKREFINKGKEMRETVSSVQFAQEIGGLVGRCAVAWLAIYLISRQRLLRLFLVPGLVIIPLVYLYPAAGRLEGDNLTWLRIGIFVTGFFTVAQFSFWGNYLPRVYPTYLRGTGESFAANVGGRMLGTSAALLTPRFAALMPEGVTATTAFAAAAVAFLVYFVGLVFSFWLPEPKGEDLPD
jgi:MFS family permease